MITSIYLFMNALVGVWWKYHCRMRIGPLSWMMWNHEPSWSLIHETHFWGSMMKQSSVSFTSFSSTSKYTQNFSHTTCDVVMKLMTTSNRETSHRYHNLRHFVMIVMMRNIEVQAELLPYHLWCGHKIVMTIYRPWFLYKECHYCVDLMSEFMTRMANIKL